MISGGASALPKPKFSGRPWGAAFTDVAAAAGVRFTFTSGDPIQKKLVIEANGSGVALLDYDSDGRLDLFLVNGSKLTPFPPGQAPTNRLYRNVGAGKFADVTQAARLAQGGWGNGVCSADYDNDGHADLYVTYYGRNVLYRNTGKGAFEEVAARSGVAGNGKDWSTGCTFFDYDRDGHADLLVTAYLDFRPDSIPKPGAQAWCLWKGAPVYCGPRGLPYGRLTLFRNRGDGTFEDVSEKSGIRIPRNYYAFTSIAADLNEDGWTDLYVACDSTPSIFLRNNRDGTFTDLATESGLAYNDNGAEQAGMGLAVADYDNDGRLDITKTNFTGDYPNLYHNSGGGIFTDIAIKAGLGVNPMYVLWGTGLEDFDNDGYRDLFQVTGHVYPEVRSIDQRESYQTARLLYRNLGNGRFEDVSALAGPGVGETRSSRGAAFGDFDNDGDMDVLVMNMHEAPSLLRNDLARPGRWVKLQLRGTKSNRAAIGALVRVEINGRPSAATVLSQSSFLSVNDARLHFGLGAAESTGAVEVIWPSGLREEFPPLAAGKLYLLEEGSGQARPLEMPQ
jgi:hypothetical protein